MHSEELRNLNASPVIYYRGDQIKEDGICGACSTHLRDEKYIKKCSSENLKGRNHSKTYVSMGG
jgi:hypothetical protein